MTGYELYSEYQDVYEYHGNTTIEITRRQNGCTIKRDWILFNSVEEAQAFFNDNCTDYGGGYVQ
jgi:hypothetical protein